jgi:diadenosine tetraphosphate (Ap4A) HIT family hydrolase
VSTFVLNPLFEATATFLADWSLSRVMLNNDARYPWILLIPRRVQIVEFHDLSEADQATLMAEIVRASRAMKQATGAAKINVGSLGNILPEMHVHIVARNPGDAAWPGPVWGQGKAVPYDEHAREDFRRRFNAALQE